jgi:2-oxoglutarate ferredoxin oxidoreductase subunit beta
VKILLFNNRIYGLTKGQYSPTSELGKKTKSSPLGTVERPVNPLSIAVAAEATFVARAIDTDGNPLREILLRTARHRGSAFVEIFQNCNVFNDGAFAEFTDKSVRDDRTLTLRHGEPMIFGRDRDRALTLRRGVSGLLQPEIVPVRDLNPAEILVHDERATDSSLAYVLSQLDHPAFPVPLGVFRSVEQPVYSDLLDAQVTAARKERRRGDLHAHLHAGETWEIHT